MHLRVAAISVLSLSLVVATGRAQVDAERFKPAVTADGWVNAEGSGVRPTADPLEFGLFLNYAHNPLVVADGDGDLDERIVGGRVGFDLGGSVTLAKPFAIGLDLPFFLGQHGDYDPSSAGLGDLRLVPKLRLLDDRKTIGLALAAEVRLPTHAGDFSGGDGPIVFVPRAILDHRFRKGIRIGANFGAAIREDTDYFNVSAGSELAYAAAIGYRIGGRDGKVELGAELNGGIGLTDSANEELPLEGFFFVRGLLGHEWELMGGPGIGLVPGYGVPTWRAFLGLRWRPTRHDRDHDGISDRDDGCPGEAEDQDHFEDLDGCPEVGPDHDRDGVPDYEDKCPDAKETINSVEDDDGCPDSGDPRVIYEDGEFKILDNVRFEHNSSVLEEDSKKTLDQVAMILKAHPEFTEVRVEGHTDDTGPDDVNQRISSQRAQVVRAYLINQGVESNRLIAEGYGSSRPKVKGRSNDARATNRRVDFVVLDTEE
ncbi:MAG: OmpA family protein [Polyangiaceae bacterium]|nr:OmpA family protein [Polyangiaceae bacterium]